MAVVVWGLAVAASGLARSLPVAVLLLMVAGAADLVSAVYRQTILQTYAPDEMRGRLQGVFIVVVAGGPRLGDLRAGATAAAFGLTRRVGRRRDRLRRSWCCRPCSSPPCALRRHVRTSELRPTSCSPRITSLALTPTVRLIVGSMIRGWRIVSGPRVPGVRWRVGRTRPG